MTRFIRFEYPRAYYLALLLLIALAGFAYRYHKDSQITCDKVCMEAMALNSEEKYDESVGLLMFYVDKFEDNEKIVDLLKETLPAYVKQQITDGYLEIQKKPKEAHGYLKAASGFSLMKDFFRALEVLTVGIMEIPESADLWMNVGIVELKKERDAEAHSAFLKVTSIDEENGQAFNQLAFLESRSKDERLIDYEKAKEHANKAVHLEPQNADFWETLSEIHFRLGEKKEAQAAIKQAILLSPTEKYYQIQESRFQTQESPSMSLLPQHIAK